MASATASHETLKQQLCQAGEAILALLDEAGGLAGETDEGFSGWKATCQTTLDQIHETIMRVAVVGAIKSGKSTLVNTLLGGDVLKRGAGVVTSMVTRVRPGAHLRAHLLFKGWDAVNADVNQAAALLPTPAAGPEKKTFDLRNAEDRQLLGQSLAGLATHQLITHDTRSAGTVLISACLQGYDRVQAYMKPGPDTVVLEGAAFSRHQDFVGDDALAVYLSDVLLEMDRPKFGGGEEVEIADCQGSDSPNPFHMAMIQDYLTLSNQIIYVISSRIGVRQADIRFLSMIRRMGMLDAVTVVLNADLSEHESVASLQESIQRVEADLRLIVPELQPALRIFSFSALFRLMEQTMDQLSPRDRQRLEHWRAETAMVDFCTVQQQHFDAFLEQTLGREKNALLLKNHLDRLDMVVSGIGNWMTFYHDLLAQDTGDTGLAGAAREQHGRLDRLKLTTKSTVDGAVNQTKTNMKQAIDRFFDSYGDGVVAQLTDFIQTYQADVSRQTECLADAGFTRTLYLVFQELKQAVDTYMAETVNPQVIRFVREQEETMAGYLDDVAGPLGAVIDDAMAAYTEAMAKTTAGASDTRADPPAIRIQPDLDALRTAAGLSPPAASATLRYSVQLRSEAMVHLGVHKMAGFFRRLFRRSGTGEAAHQDAVAALQAAVKRMKQETRRSILFHLKDYRENIKFQYLTKLADAAGAALYRQLLSRFQHHGADLTRLVQQIGDQHLDKQQMIARLDLMRTSVDTLNTQLGDIRTRLQDTAV